MGYKVIHTDVTSLKAKFHRPLMAFNEQLRSHIFTNIKNYPTDDKKASLAALREKLIDVSDEAAKRGSDSKLLLEVAALSFLIMCISDERMKDLVDSPY